MASTDTGFGKVKVFEDFRGPAVDTTNIISVNSENSGTTAVSIAEDGVQALVTGATSGNRSATGLALNWYCNHGGLIFEARVKNITAITARALYIGISDVAPATTLENPIEMSGSTLTTTATDAAGFMYDTDATIGDWYCVSVKNGSDGTPYDTAIVPAAAATYQTFRVVLNSDGDADFFIDGKFVKTITDAVTATVALCAYICLETRASAAKTAHVDYIYMEKPRGG